MSSAAKQASGAVRRVITADSVSYKEGKADLPTKELPLFIAVEIPIKLALEKTRDARRNLQHHVSMRRTCLRHT